MKLFEDTHPQAPSAATIGFFDGVHLGHRFLIEQVKEAASQAGLCSSIITFLIHPRQVIQSDYQPQLLSSPEEKIELLGTTGIDQCILLPFTKELSQLTAKEFMKLLRDEYQVRMLVIGYDHRFGHNRAENFEDYCRYGEELGISILRANAYTQAEDKVSSSAVRRALQNGEIEIASQYLGHSYSIEGIVVDGYKVGRKIGFPTANLQLTHTHKLIPAEGVYVVYAQIENKRWKGMLNIGRRPTLNNGSNLSIEVHILDFNEDIYQKKIRIEFVHFLRPEVKFQSTDELIEQMQKDKEATIRLLSI